MVSSTIKMFQFNQKFCQIIGIKLPKTNGNRYTFEPVHLIFVICLTLFAMTLLAFLVYDAKSMVEYGIIFLMLITIILTLVVYFITIWRMKDILKFTENCETFIERSKPNVVPISSAHITPSVCFAYFLQQGKTKKWHTVI